MAKAKAKATKATEPVIEEKTVMWITEAEQAKQERRRDRLYMAGQIAAGLVHRHGLAVTDGDCGVILRMADALLAELDKPETEIVAGKDLDLGPSRFERVE